MVQSLEPQGNLLVSEVTYTSQAAQPDAVVQSCETDFIELHK